MRELTLKKAPVGRWRRELEGRNTWMFGADPEARAWGAPFIGEASLHIMGSLTFQAMAADAAAAPLRPATPSLTAGSSWL